MKHFKISVELWKKLGDYSLEIYLFGESNSIVFNIARCLDMPCMCYYIFCVFFIFLETYLYVKIVGFIKIFLDR